MLYGERIPDYIDSLIPANSDIIEEIRAKAAADKDELTMAVLEAGGSDLEDAGEEWIVSTAPSDLMAVKKALEAEGIEVKGAEMTMIPTTPTQISVSDAKKVMRLIDNLEALEDLQNVYHTMEMTDEIAAALDEE